jgi:hypothetical protein
MMEDVDQTSQKMSSVSMKSLSLGHTHIETNLPHITQLTRMAEMYQEVMHIQIVRRKN